MAANSLGALRAMIMKEVNAAMVEAQREILADMKKNMDEAYAAGSPKQYSRTGALKDTPRVSDVASGGNRASFEAYLDQSHGYSTGDNPSMGQVLDLVYGSPWTTASGRPAKPTVIKGGFWEKSKDNMQSKLDAAMANHFGKG